jgi:UDP-glucose 4-epimerase
MNDKIRCAVIGGNGYIGRHIVAYLRSMNISTHCYDLSGEDSSGFTQIDLADKESIHKIDINVDYIFFMTGLTGTYIGFDRYDDFIDINEKALLHLLTAIRSSPYRPRIIYPSSRLVYKGNENKCLAEDDEKDGKTIYAINKICSEMLLNVYEKCFNIPYTIFRICVPYGDDFSQGYSFGTIGFFIKQALARKDIVLYGDGNLKRTFTNISDICALMINCSLKKQSENEIYNIGGETLSLKDAALIIARKYGVNVSFAPWPKQDLLIESGSTMFDDSKIQKIIGGYIYRKIIENIL